MILELQDRRMQTPIESQIDECLGIALSFDLAWFGMGLTFQTHKPEFPVIASISVTARGR